MALNISGITSAIASLSVTGVTIKNINAIPETVNNRDCPLLFPQPEAWSDASQGFAEESITFGTANTRYWQFTRTLNYVFVNNAVGTGRGNSDNYLNAVQRADLISQAMITLDVSDVDIEKVSHNAIGVIQDPTGNNKFIGCLFSVTLRERINA